MRPWSLTGTFVWFSVSKAIPFYTFLDKARHAGNVKALAVFVARKKKKKEMIIFSDAVHSEIKPKLDGKKLCR